MFVSTLDISDHEVKSSELSKCIEPDTNLKGVLIFSFCPGFNYVMNYASLNAMFDYNHKWLIMNSDSIIRNNETDLKNITNYENKFEINSAQYGKDGEIEENTIHNVLNSLDIHINADITLALMEGDSYKYKLYEVYSYGKTHGGLLNSQHLGSWRDTKTLETSCECPGLIENLNKYKYYRQWNFYGIRLKMIVVYLKPVNIIFNPKVFSDVSTTPGVADITKTSYNIIQVLADIHNIRFNFTLSDRWIGETKTNQTKSVANSIYYKEQDISPLIRLMNATFPYVDVLHPALSSIETKYYYRIPDYGVGNLENQFLRPFVASAWWCILAVSVFCATVLTLSAIFENRPAGFEYAVFSVIASICQQFYEDLADSDLRKISSARKVTIFVTGVSCVLTYNYYTSSVVSWLLSGPPPSINSLEELLNSPLELIYEDIGYTRSWMQSSTYYYNKRNAKIEDEIRRKRVFNKKKGNPLYETIEDGIQMVKAGGYAYHTEVSSANRLIAKTFTAAELCELGSLQSMDQTKLYACVQKRSPYKEFFVWGLSRLSERGVVRREQARMAAPEVVCGGSSPRALALGGAAPAFLLLIGGAGLALSMLTIEMLVHKYSYLFKC